MPAAAGSTSVTVTSPGGCGWTASSSASWLTGSSGTSGTGTGSVKLAIQENTGAPRSGTATIAGQVFTVNQASGCSYGRSASSRAIPGTWKSGIDLVEIEDRADVELYESLEPRLPRLQGRANPGSEAQTSGVLRGVDVRGKQGPSCPDPNRRG